MKKDRAGDLAQRVADFVCSDIQLDGTALDRAKIVFADTISATVAGAASDVIEPLRNYIGARPPANADKVILGTGLRSSDELAAMVNGTMAAALEFDDVLSLMPGHPSAVVVAALMANDRALDASGAQVIKAYAVGVEAGARVAQALTLDHYKRGFHTTGTLALFSAVAALAQIQRLSPTLVKRSLGLAASMSSGLQGNFGTMAKPLHSGWAARNAVAAVAMATAGVTACEEIFEAEGGYFSAYGSPNSNASQIPAAFGQPWVFDDPGVTLKLFPCCYASHRAMDGLMGLLRSMNLPSSGVRQVQCLVPPGGLIPLKFDRPKTHFESLFSLPYALAVTLLDGMPGLRSFRQERVLADDVASMLERIEVLESPLCVEDYPDYDSTSYGSRGEVRLRVEASDGRSDSVRVRFAPGHPQRPMSWDQAQAKFQGCLDSAGLPPELAANTFPMIRDIERLSNFRTLVEAFSI